MAAADWEWSTVLMGVCQGPPSSGLSTKAPAVHRKIKLAVLLILQPQGGSEKLSDEAIEETLEKVVKLLAYISDKDLFAEFYRKRLARRLLQVCWVLQSRSSTYCMRNIWLYKHMY